MSKNAIVCGIQRSGLSACKLLLNLGYDVTPADSEGNEDKLGNYLKEIKALGIPCILGTNPDDIVGNFDMMVLSPGIPGDMPFIQKAKALGVNVISEVELAFLNTPCPVIAITGTNGKTTTTSLTGEILKGMTPDTHVVGNIGIPYTECVEKLHKDSIVVAEISSFQMENSFTFKPNISAILNFTPDHLNRHKTYERYIAEKEKVFTLQTEEDFLILNYDDDICRKLAKKAKSQVIYFSAKNELKEGIYLKDKNIIVNYNGIHDTIINVSEMMILGEHNFENAMAAAIIGIIAGVPIDKIRHVLRTFKGVSHRLEFVTEKEGIKYYNDSKATNNDSAIKALLAMEKKVILIGGGMDKGIPFDDWIAYFKDRVKYAIFLGETKYILKESCERLGFNDFTIANSLEDAVPIAKEVAHDGDIVLFSPACASWDMFPSFEVRGEIFKQLVLK